ncbi:hypothetical protein Tco_0344273 [Tanacetum coccineum]
MNTTLAQQKALHDALVAPMDRLEFGKYNIRLKTDIKPKEATFQVVLDALTLTPFYQAFLIIAKVPAIYIQEFWATVTICPKIPGQWFEDPLLEPDILSFIRDLGHTRDIHYITGVSIDYLHQPWRACTTIINKCLSGKDTAYEKIHLSRAQILWGMYNNKNIDYVYLLWEDFFFQVENKETKKTNKMLYTRFTKVIIDYFMSRDQSISRRNKMFWHTARDDTMFTSMRCVSRHEKTQVYGAIIPQHLTNQAMLESIAYQTYYTYATGEKALKEKYVGKKADSDTSPKKKPATKGTRIKTSAKVAKYDKKKQPAKMPKTKGLVILSEVALSETEQLKLATERSKLQFHSSRASGSSDGVDTQSKVPNEQQQKVTGTNEGAGVRPEVLDVPKDDSESEEESWIFSQDDNDAEEESDMNDDSEETESDNDEIDFTHPNLSTYKEDDQEEEEKKADDEEVFSDQREEEEEEDMYRDLNVNLERSDAEMTDAQANQETDDAHVTLTTKPPVVQQQSSFVSSDLVSKYINPSPDAGVDSILEQDTQSDSLVNVPVSIAAETPSYIRDEAQAENQEFLNKVDSTIKKIIKEQVQAQVSKIMPKMEKYVTESLKSEVLVRSTNQPQTSYAVAASLS